MKDGFDVNALGFQLAQNFVDQGAIFHHQKMGIEDSGVLCPDRFRDLLLHFQNLNPRLDKGGFEPGNLGRNLRRIESDRKSTRLNSSHSSISYAVFCLKKKKKKKLLT